ncbi:MAG: cytidylate kinase-like family protein [Thermoanaerobaculales bacterium]|jgi:cytidylate kinase|nr:cytidylate kinase-like family protein [Thermoanaerobaculales bacterium]
MPTSTEERRQGSIATTQVEYQMRFHDLISRVAASREAALDQPTCGPFLTVSREAGSKGALVARQVAQRLGWAVLDKELVEQLASDLEVEPGLLDLLDERRANWFSETLLNLFNTRLVAQHGYVEQVSKVIALAAATEPVVIVGRGAHLILPADAGFRVRIVATWESRVHWIAQREDLDLKSAEKRISDIDADRQGFIVRNLRQDATDPSLYDLTLNTARLGVAGCVELIVRAMELKNLL